MKKRNGWFHNLGRVCCKLPLKGKQLFGRKNNLAQKQPKKPKLEKLALALI